MGSMRIERRNAKQWQEHVESQRNSDMSIEAYCKEHDLGISSFYAWNRRFSKKKKTLGDNGFIELKRTELTGRMISIETPEGYRLSMNSCVTPQEMRRVLEALR